jgi:ABC-type molybdenum transport system ATPase subunit/photorepair protein PhrA
LGGGRGRPRKQVSKIFDVNKFVAIVTERMEMDFKSKKEMWESIALEYYGAIRVDKRKIDKLPNNLEKQ